MGLHYLVVNIMASLLFLIGVATMYAVAGTLNLADLAMRAGRIAGAEAALLQAGGMLLLVVFGFKAALLPLHLWLPGTYAAATAPVAALFALHPIHVESVAWICELKNTQSAVFFLLATSLWLRSIPPPISR